MGLRSLLAKDWRLDVDTSAPGASAPVWTPVRGLSKFEETTDDNVEDDGDFDDEEGWGADVVTERKWKIEAEGRRKRTDAAVFTPDPGQQFIRKAARKVGFAANIKVRWYRRDGADDAYEGVCTVSEFTKGGEKTDLEPFSFTLLGQNAPVEIENPVAA
ncbi:phage tail tube protein [Nonomuraea lactucae]|uniref:phage tail tube protein n=1 Tax=Nonomuraea lactucae TaxID=2249762 RepID=UPI000DE21D86|nr:hypothetical protein [Nonomuraea lactucae]